MKKENLRKICIAGVLSALLTVMQTVGWQVSMKNGTSVHSSSFFQNIGQLELGQLIMLGCVEFFLYGIFIYWIFDRLNKSSGYAVDADMVIPRRFIWFAAGILLYSIYIFYLIGCYPGFYNYDVGNQIPQVLYDEVPYSAHHPILHTLIEGGIIALGYKIYGVDLTLGVFLYCAFQMAVCAVSFTYCIYFIYKYTYRKAVAAAAFVFYALCPPVIMFAMSTTKDVICYTVLLVAVLKMFELYQDLKCGSIGVGRWVQLGVLLALPCLFRKNIIYVVTLFAAAAIVFIRKERKKQILMYAGVIVSAFLINRSLILITNASEGSPMEAFSIPVQQIARLYRDEGEAAFEEDELLLLYSFVDKEMLTNYDPFISDAMKYAFWLHYDTISSKMGDFFALWAKKGLQYPFVYLMAFVDNTYQAWYPGTVLRDTKGFRYFDITGWQERNGRPKMIWLYDFYKNIYVEASYQKFPFIRLFFSIGFMLWAVLTAWFYGAWKKEWGILTALGFVLCVSVTNFAGPVSDIRYYLLEFYAFPLCVAVLTGRRGGKICAFSDAEKSVADVN